MNLPFVSFRYTYTFAASGAVITSDSTLRFRSREELQSSLAAQHYQVHDIREAPDRPGREYVFIASVDAVVGGGQSDAQMLTGLTPGS